MTHLKHKSHLLYLIISSSLDDFAYWEYKVEVVSFFCWPCWGKRSRALNATRHSLKLQHDQVNNGAELLLDPPLLRHKQMRQPTSYLRVQKIWALNSARSLQCPEPEVSLNLNNPPPNPENTFKHFDLLDEGNFMIMVWNSSYVAVLPHRP